MSKAWSKVDEGAPLGEGEAAKSTKRVVGQHFLNPEKVVLVVSCQALILPHTGRRGVTDRVSEEVWVCEEAYYSAEDIFSRFGSCREFMVFVFPCREGSNTLTLVITTWRPPRPKGRR